MEAIALTTEWDEIGDDPRECKTQTDIGYVAPSTDEIATGDLGWARICRLIREHNLVVSLDFS